MPTSTKKATVDKIRHWSFFQSDGQKIHERVYVKSELLEVWKNLRVSGTSDEQIDYFKQLIFSDEY